MKYDTFARNDFPLKALRIIHPSRLNKPNTHRKLLQSHQCKFAQLEIFSVDSALLTFIPSISFISNGNNND